MFALCCAVCRCCLVSVYDGGSVVHGPATQPQQLEFAANRSALLRKGQSSALLLHSPLQRYGTEDISHLLKPQYTLLRGMCHNTCYNTYTHTKNFERNQN